MARLIVACPCLEQLALTCFVCRVHLYIFSAWAKSDERDAVEHALSILGIMEENGLQPNIQTYTCVIDAIAPCGTSHEHVQVVVRLYHAMTEEGSTAQPDILALNGVFSALEALGNKGMSRETYKHALQNGLVNPWRLKKTRGGERIRVLVGQVCICQ
jgi:hypothetical protein